MISTERLLLCFGLLSTLRGESANQSPLMYKLTSSQHLDTYGPRYQVTGLSVGPLRLKPLCRMRMN
jgi:hypothetical protein